MGEGRRLFEGDIAGGDPGSCGEEEEVEDCACIRVGVCLCV